MFEETMNVQRWHRVYAPKPSPPCYIAPCAFIHRCDSSCGDHTMINPCPMRQAAHPSVIPSRVQCQTKGVQGTNQSPRHSQVAFCLAPTSMLVHLLNAMPGAPRLPVAGTHGVVGTHTTDQTKQMDHAPQGLLPLSTRGQSVLMRYFL